MGSNNEVFSPTEAEGIKPMEPEITDASSVKISPNKFSVIKTWEKSHKQNGGAILAGLVLTGLLETLQIEK